MKPRARQLLRDVLVLLAIVVAAALMEGCSAVGGAITVKTAVPVACDQAEPERPFMPTDDLRPGADVNRYVRAARAERLVRQGYEDRLVTALRACIKPVDAQAKVN